MIERWRLVIHEGVEGMLCNQHASTRARKLAQKRCRLLRQVKKENDTRAHSLASLSGLRFTVTLREGSANPEFVIAAVTRSRASFTALLARPTIVHAGSPVAPSTSTVTS